MQRRKGKRAHYYKNKGTGKMCYIYLTSCALCFRYLFVILLHKNEDRKVSPLPIPPGRG